MEVVQYKFVILYVNCQRAEVNIFENYLHRLTTVISWFFFPIDWAKELFERLKKIIIERVIIKVEKNNGQSRNHEFVNVIKMQHQN